MPLQKLQYRPGVSRESTDLANEGGWYACNAIRFRSGAPENIGGWTTITPTTFLGACRNLVEWETLAEPVGFLLLGLGTNLKYYLLSNQTFYDITPFGVITSVTSGAAMGTNPFLPIYSTLASSITATDTTITLVSGTSFSRVFPLIVRIGSEDIYAQYASGNTLSGCTRGYNGTTAATHASSTPVSSSWIVANSPANGSGVGCYVDFVGATAFGPYAATDLNKDFYIQGQSTNYVAVDTGVQSTSATVGGGANVVGYYEIAVGADYATQGQGFGAGVWDSVVLTGNPTTLSSNVSFTATTISVASTTGFAASGYIAIDSEIIQYAAIAGNTFTGCTRSIGGTFNGSGTSWATVPPNTSHITGATVRQAVYPGALAARAWNTPATVGVNIPLRLWSSDNFGQDLVMNIRDNAVYYWRKTDNMTLSGATIPLPTTAPWSPNGHAVNIRNLTISSVTADAWAPYIASRVIVTDQRHIVALGTNDWALTSTSQDPMLVRWCEQENPLIWQPTPTNTAGFQRLSYGSKIITAEKTREETLIWTDSALYSMRYLGPPYTFGFNTISAEITIASPNAVTTTNNITYWMGIDKFYVYSGRVDTLPCSLRQYIFDDINNLQSDQIYSGSNEKYNEVWWFYCSAGSSQIDRYVIYNYLEKLWYYGQMPRTSWYDSHIRTYPVATYSKSASFKVSSVDSGTGAVTGVTLNQAGDYEVVPGNPCSGIGGTGAGVSLVVTYSTRSATSAVISSGGQGYTVGDLLTIAGPPNALGTPTGNILLQEYGVNDATNPSNPVSIASYIESADFDIGDGDQFSFVKRLIPDVDFIGSTAVQPALTMTLSARDYPGQGMFRFNNNEIVASTSQVSVQVYNYTNDIWLRMRGRQVAFTISSDALGVKWQLGIPRIDIQSDGRR